MEDRFGRDLQFVRVHVGRRAEALTMEVGCRAFCFRNHVYLGCGLQRDVLEHEIAHLLVDSDSPTIRCWKNREHRELTMEVGRRFFRNPRALEMLSEAANAMDYRPGRLPALVPYLGGKVVCGYFLNEGAEHGEGGMYDVRVAADITKAAAINVAAMNMRLAEAFRFYRELRRLWDMPDRDIPRANPHLEKIEAAMRSMVEKLGDALHIAQDRGAHWEGFAGRGHQDPRALPRMVLREKSFKDIKTTYKVSPFVCTEGWWNPDDRTLNMNYRGYQNAEKYTEEVFRTFKRMTSADKLLFR